MKRNTVTEAALSGTEPALLSPQLS